MLRCRAKLQSLHARTGYVFLLTGAAPALIRHNLMANLRPDNLGTAVAALNAGRLDDAQSMVAAALDQDVDNAQAQHLAGVIAMIRGEPREAVRRFSRAVQRNPQLASAHSNLGLAKLELGFGEDAQLHCRRAAELRPEDAELTFNLAVVLQASGRLRDAEREYRRALRRNPEHAKALLNLGSVLHRLGNKSGAEDCFREGLARFPGDGEFARNLGHLLISNGEFEAAADCFRVTLVRASDDTDARAGLAEALRRQGQTRQAVEVCLGVDEQLRSPDLCRQLGLSLLESGELEPALAAFERSLAIKRRPGNIAVTTGDQLESTRAKLRHDIEQFEWLQARGLLDDDFSAAASACRKVIDSLPADLPAAAVFTLPFPARRRLQGFYNRIVHRGAQPALQGGALNPSLQAAEIQADYRANAPGMTVVDDFLRPAALTGLRRFCLESTLWFDFMHPNGYLGAYLEEGFYCPLLLQVAEQLRQLLPDTIGDMPLRQMWAYKYDSRLDGIETHADFAAVNVNFWITPESANRDPDSGGMIVWDKEAPPDWDFNQYNSSARDGQERIRSFLAESGAREKKVLYRENRAVIFNSDLFHKTDRISFAGGYENRRINITMLFGARGDR